MPASSSEEEGEEAKKSPRRVVQRSASTPPPKSQRSQRILDRLKSPPKRERVGYAAAAASRSNANRDRRAAEFDCRLQEYLDAATSAVDGDYDGSNQYQSGEDDKSSEDVKECAPSSKKRQRPTSSDSSSSDEQLYHRGSKTKRRMLPRSPSPGGDDLRNTSSDESDQDEFQSPRRSPRKPKPKTKCSSRKALEKLRKELLYDNTEDEDEGGDCSKTLDEAEEPPMSPLCLQCNESMQCLTSQVERTFGKKFFKCHKCGDFVWYADANGWKRRMPSGPRCKCGEPSYPILTRETKKRLWVCSKTGGGQCSFELSIGKESNNLKSNDDLDGLHRSASTDEEFLCGVKTKQALQEFFNMEHVEVENLLHADYRSKKEPMGYYDHFHVERAWKVNPGKDGVAEFDAFRKSLDGIGAKTNLRFMHKRSIDALLKESTASLEPLDSSSNEVLLLHGTKPEVVHDILVQGLNPDMARPGLFGRGTYFADHPAKINQYVHADTEYKGGKREKRHGKVCTLHNKLYPTADLHPGNVFYCLVCRVVLGNPDCSYLRIDKPRNGGHCIVAELGYGNKRLFREFVIFDKRAIKIEYVVAYTRTKYYCKCGSVVRERTYKDPDLKKQRKCISCPNSFKNQKGVWEGGCRMFSPLPRCFCKRNVDFAPALPDVIKGIYRCKLGKCTFHRLIEQGVDLREYEDADSGPSDYSSDDGFVVKDGLYEKMKAK